MKLTSNNGLRSLIVVTGSIVQITKIILFNFSSGSFLKLGSLINCISKFTVNCYALETEKICFLFLCLFLF